MTVRFIIGRAGSGKTCTCLNEVREGLLKNPAGPPLVLLVPEQATFQTEYALATTPGLKGFIRAQVLSFRRLAYRVLQEVGGASRPHIGELGKRMVLRRLLEQRRKDLKVFRRSATQPGFTDTLARTLGEMKTYCVGPQDLMRASSAVRETGGADLLADKLDDLLILYNELEDYLSGRFTDPDDYLNLLAGRLEQATVVHEGEVWVDGFSGFTPQEYQVLAVLARAARRVNITLCADLKALSGGVDETELFYPIKETYDTLCEIAARERVPVERPLVLNGSSHSRYQNSFIAHVERHFFAHPAPACTCADDSVVLVAAANPRAEVEGVAREITALCRDKGYRYRDIIILMRDLDAYAGLISCVFEDYGIPVFIDRKRMVMHHPLVELVRSALEVVASDWSFDPVFRFFKTDLTPLTREEVDLLENYVLAHGIRGSRWIDGKPWEYRRWFALEENLETTTAEDEEELETINCIRRKAVGFLLEFHDSILRAENVRSLTEALFNLLGLLNVSGQLENWSRGAEEEGRLEEAREHFQVWSGLITMLDQVVEALGETTISVEEYAAVLDAGFESMRLGLIPPGLDQVVAGSLERSRSPEAKASFVMGVNDGILPARISGKGMLSESDRDRLLAVGLRLAPGGRRKVFEEQYIVYTALTRSSERLYLTYPTADDEGGAIAPSPVVARVRELLPGVGEKVWPVEPGASPAGDLEFITCPSRALSNLAAQMREVKAGREINPLWWDVYNWFALGGRRKECASVLSSLFFINREGRLPTGVSKKLYGRPLKTSISGIEKFRACPFAHFLSKGLKLQERAVFKLGAPDLGRFFHAALKLFGDRIREQKLDWGELGKGQCREMAGEVVDLLVPRLQSEILLSSARRRYLTGKLKRIVQRTALVLTEHSRRGSFRPVGLELAFGPRGNLPAATFTLSGGYEMVLTGCIDRVDAARGEEDEGVYLRIIDYKSGKITINLADIYHGLKLQLLVYLDVALKYAHTLVNGKAMPGAILYFRLDDPLIRTGGEMLTDAELESNILKEFRMTGMVLADLSVVKLMDNNIGRYSKLIPVSIKNDGSFAAYSAVLTSEQFETLRAWLRHQLTSAGSEIVNGMVDIRPYRRGTARACQYCPYKPVCRFDVLVEGNSYREIKLENNDAIWKMLAEQTGGEDI